MLKRGKNGENSFSVSNIRNNDLGNGHTKYSGKVIRYGKE